MQTESILKKNYWSEAAKQFGDLKMILVAAIFISLRVAIKPLQIPFAADLKITFDCYVNSLGSMIYGPLVALAVGAVSDTLGCLLFPSGAYFFPFIFVEMASGFIFALFFWRRKISPGRCILAKFTVNFICNIIMTSAVMKWDYYIFYGLEKAQAYNLINLTRIAKNLIMFPIEAVIIFAVLSAVSPALAKIGVIRKSDTADKKITVKHIIIAIILLLVSIALILFFVFFLKDFIKLHNIKMF